MIKSATKLIGENGIISDVIPFPSLIYLNGNKFYRKLRRNCIDGNPLKSSLVFKASPIELVTVEPPCTNEILACSLLKLSTL
jgi:hypothetical protein